MSKQISFRKCACGLDTRLVRKNVGWQQRISDCYLLIYRRTCVAKVPHISLHIYSAIAANMIRLHTQQSRVHCSLVYSTF
jgi:hypothetical protein